MRSARAVRIRGAGGPETLDIGEIELPEPEGTQVLVRVEAAGLNRADCLQRKGFYPAPSGVPPDVPGLEFAGVVDAVGPEVVRWLRGDRVMGIVGGGGMAELVLTEEAELMRVPEGLTIEQAAAVPEVFLTAYDAIVLQGELKPGEAVLLHAVASGVGTAAIQIAAAVGARSLGTSRTADKLDRCAELGLGHAIHVEEGAFANAVRAVVDRGVDVILDTVGGAYLGENLKAIATKGRIVVIGLMGGAEGALPLGLLLAKRASIRGSVLRSRGPDEKAALTSSFAEQMLGRFETGELAPVVDDVLAMNDIQVAHAKMDANETFGKLVLRWS